MEIKIEKIESGVDVNFALEEVELNWTDISTEVKATINLTIELKATVVYLYQEVKDKLNKQDTMLMAGVSMSCDDLIVLGNGILATVEEGLVVTETDMPEYLSALEASGKLDEALTSLSKDYIMTVLPKVAKGNEDVVQTMQEEIKVLDAK